jgi:hypothetical protein
MRRNKAKKYGLYSRPFHFHFYILTIMKFCSINYYIFYTFLCILEQQRAPSPPILPIHGDGDVAATPNSGYDVPISDASQQAHDIDTQVLSHASSIFFLQIVADIDV